ncbi:hypothetical protein A374_13960 [Fictibacillus macauensis ZFHKF-1]|uniref:DUF3311 domain-containing protein n=1 Tax=Fictibacillus macauensis ZFHKF-1 TaxID=1196324 RepID=I8AGJ3_9BACL|nr:DUF3311 domain-containing protein [Fictibacillus macauensis]EIT84802.1 hypothetical protein A374_13960 [Fictibacillus macauensis ZFHKF-1]
MRKVLLIILIALPIISQLIALPFVNSIHPIIVGLPFFHFWLVLWIFLTPLCTWGIYALQKAEGSID